MLQRFNYTQRKRIAAKDVKIKVLDGKPRTFEALIDLPTGLPKSGRVFIDAYTSGAPTSRRFDFGSVGDVRRPEDTSLDGLEGTLLFNVRVVDAKNDNGLLLAAGSGFRPTSGNKGAEGGPDADADTVSLLPVNPIDLGTQVWRVNFSHDRPWLEINNKIPQCRELVHSDKLFFSLVFPVVVRQILERVLLIDRFDLGEEDDPLDWRSEWTRWAIHWHPSNERPPVSDLDDVTERGLWIEEVVDGFCQQHGALKCYSEATKTDIGSDP